MSPIRPLKSLLLCSSAAILLSGNVFAVSLGDTGTGINAPGAFQSGLGGEFYFQYLSGSISNAAYNAPAKNQGGIANSFQTFCIEWDEFIGGADTTLNYVVNDEAVDGGVNTHGPAGNQGGDIISLGTAWLYSMFADGTLSGYFTAPSRTAQAALLQVAFWALEDEHSNPTGNPYFDAAQAQFGTASYKSNAAAGQFGVYVLNNTSGGTKNQDMLFFAGRQPGDDGNPVPDGGSTLALLGLGLAGFSAFSKRRPKA